LVMVRDLLERWSPDSVRFYLSGFHYRDSWSYEEGGLESAEQQVDDIRKALTVSGEDGQPIDAALAWQDFTQAMEDDLDTPAAERVILDLAQEIVLAGGNRKNVRSAQEALRRMAGVIGLQLDAKDPEARVVEGWSQHLTRFEAGRVDSWKVED
ncbi:MAG: hypothetical protein P8Y03_29980, partial [Anaerolineales bacterium]